MSNSDQQLIDLLYNNIYMQKIKCEYYFNKHISPDSMWNKHTDEHNIMELYIKKYKQFYIDKSNELIIKLIEIKNANINSYLTFNPEQYENLHTTDLNNINIIVNQINSKNINSILSDKISILFKPFNNIPIIFVDPTLLKHVV